MRLPSLTLGWRRVIAAAALAAALLPCRLDAQDATRFVIHASDRREYVLHMRLLDVEMPDGVDPQTIVLPTGTTRGIARAGWTSVNAVDMFLPTPTRAGLVEIARTIEALNPGARTNFVVYEGNTNLPRQRVLTREVGVLLADGADVSVISAVTSAVPRAVPGVPGAYVLDAPEPLDAPPLADALRAVAGVTHAYPLLRTPLVHQ